MVFVIFLGVLIGIPIALYIGKKLYQGGKALVNYLRDYVRGNGPQHTQTHTSFNSMNMEDVFAQVNEVSFTGHSFSQSQRRQNTSSRYNSYIRLEQNDEADDFSGDVEFLYSKPLPGRGSSEQIISPLYREKDKLRGIQKKQHSEQKNTIPAIQTKIELAQSHEMKQLGKSDKRQAFAAYLEVAKLGGEEALAPLERIAEDLGSEEQKKLSELYQFFKNPQKEKYWLDKAQEIEGFDFNS